MAAAGVFMVVVEVLMAAVTGSFAGACFKLARATH